jgi:hypothetical protein
VKHFTGCDLPFLDPQESGAPGDFAQLTTKAEVLEAVRRDLGDTVADALVASLAAEPEPPEPEAEVVVERGPGDTLN